MFRERARTYVRGGIMAVSSLLNVFDKKLNIRQRKSLRVKIAWFAITVGLIPLAIIGAYSYFASQRAIDASVRTTVHDRTEQLKSNLEKYFQETRVTLLSIAGSPAWLKYYTDPKMKEDWRREQQRIINYMDDATKIGIDEFCFVGQDGKENTRLVKGELEYDLSEDEKDNPFFEPSFELGPNEVFTSAPYKSPDTTRWVMATTTLLYGPAGEKLAFLHLERNVAQIQDILRKAVHRKGEQAFILDEKGNAILSSTGKIDAKAKELSVNLPASAKAALASHDDAESKGSPAEAETEVATYSQGGSGYYVSSEKVSADKNNVNNWRIALSIPQSAVADYKNSFAFLPMLVLVILGFVIGGALMMGRMLTGPVVALVSAADRVAGGELDVTVSVEEGDELGLLAKAFNQMTANLKALIESEKAAKEYLELTVGQYNRFIDEVASGDLTGRLSLNGKQDELSALGANLNGMVGSLGRMVAKVAQATNDIASSSSEIFAATTQQNSSATQQAAAINETTATVDEVRQTAEQSTDRAKSVAESARKTVEISDTGTQAVEKTIDGMAQIKDKVEQIAANIITLSEQTQQISNIIATVNDIADQSNLLALNASIEAARAGEQGKGFAVVASEVRNLAEQSRQATAQVKAILDDIQKATNIVVMVTEDGTKNVDNGMDLANQAGDTIRALVEAISESATAAEQIVASAQQQAAGMDQVATAMAEINQSTSQALASTKQTEKAAEHLSQLGTGLKETIALYRVEENSDRTKVTG